MAEEYILETFDISKHFSGVVALSNINIRVRRGGVHAFLGENGAGKSTLVKIISGGYTADTGHFRFDGEDITQLTPKEALARGIAIVYQELNLFPELSITENIFLGREKTTGGRIRWKEMHEDAEELLRSFDLHYDVRTKVGSLSIAEQQMVEIVRCLSMNAKLIIMDEPTDVLTDRETEQLFGLIRRMQRERKTIIYISHRLDELKQICETFSVFRDGRHVFTGDVQSHTKDEIVQMMVARTLTEQYPYVPGKPGPTVLQAQDICCGRLVQGARFEARKGEILGIYGLVGSGRTEMMRALIGADKLQSGSVTVDGKPLKCRNPGQAMKNGVVYITESRKEYGLMQDMTVAFNCTISTLGDCLNALRGIDGKKETAAVDKAVQSLAIKTPTIHQEVRKLSGGNQQKVLLARFILTRPKVLIVDEPTRGVDVGAKVSIYKILNELKAEGMAIVMISSDMPEVLGVSDRVAVMYSGRVTGVFGRDELCEEALAACAFGKTKEGC